MTAFVLIFIPTSFQLPSNEFDPLAGPPGPPGVPVDESTLFSFEQEIKKRQMNATGKSSLIRVMARDFTPNGPVK
jgi:hypothetical protein